METALRAGAVERDAPCVETHSACQHPTGYDRPWMVSRLRLPQPRQLRLGYLELAVLDGLWQHGPMDVTTAHRTVPEARGLARNTVQSTLQRLVRKRLAERRKIGRAYEYRATLSRADWITQALGALLDSVPGAHDGPALASFVDLAERAGEASLEELEKLVRRRRQALSEDS